MGRVLRPPASSPSATTIVGLLDAAAYGAIGDGTTDDRAALQAAIDAAAALDYQAEVLLGAAIYGVGSELEHKPGVRLVGTHHPHWIASTGQGTTIKALAGFTGDHVLGIDGSSTDHDGAGLRGVMIDANDLAAYGIEMVGRCREHDWADVEVVNATTINITIANSSSRQPQELYARRVFARSGTDKGFKIVNSPDMNFDYCGAMSNLGDGWTFQGVSNSRFTSPIAEWNQGKGFVIDGGSASDGLRFDNLSTDSNYDTGVWVGSCSDSRPIVFGGTTHLRRDGRNLGSTYGAAVGAQGSGFSAPVVFENLVVTVKPDDAGGTLYRPITALRVGGFADAVLLGGGYLWGVTNAITSGAAASVTRVGKPTALVTGDPGSQSRSYVSTTTGVYTVD